VTKRGVAKRGVAAVVRPKILRAGSLAAAALLLAPAQVQTGVPADFFELLRTRIGVSSHDLAVTLPAGRAVAMLLPVRQKGEVSVAGVERLRVPLEFFLDAFREAQVVKRDQQVLQIREFSDPPSLQDLQSLKLAPEEIQALSTCSPDDCSVKLSAPMMQQLRGMAGAPSIENRFGELMLQLVTQYLEKGDSAMISYADKRPAVSSLDEFHALLQEFDWLREYAPPLYDCLESFSGKSCPDVKSFVYWSSAKFGFKRVFSITQMTIYRTTRAQRPWDFIAFKQIYADHYFEGSLGLAVLAEQSAGPINPELWVLYVNRSLTDAFGGWLGPLMRSITQQRSRSALEENLLELKENFEGRYSRR
jgi:hypothetical protein